MTDPIAALRGRTIDLIGLGSIVRLNRMMEDGMFTLQELEALRDACAFTITHALDDMVSPEPMDRLAKVAEKIEEQIAAKQNQQSRFEKREIAFNALTEEYTAWCKSQGIEAIDAQERALDENITVAQHRWVVDFCKRWEAAEQGD